MTEDWEHDHSGLVDNPEEDGIVTVIVVRRDGSAYVDSSVSVGEDMWECPAIWLSNDEERFRLAVST